MGTLIQDIRYGMRTMLRSPALTLVAMLSLALGIGANTAIFSLMNAVMLRALPVKEPVRLVLLGRGRWAGITIEFPNRKWDLFSYPFYRELQQKNRVFSGTAAIHSMRSRVHAAVDGSTSSEPVDARLVSASYFATLGVNPILGRTFTDADDQTPGNHPVAVAETLARRFFPKESPLGKRFKAGESGHTREFEIIGIVKDSKYESLKEKPQPVATILTFKVPST